MMTKRLFENNAYSRRFQAGVLAERTVNGRQAVLLDQTLFFPESGGQPYDTGKLNDVPVVSVSEEEGELLHHLEGRLEVGMRVEGEIDWERRFDHMQQHSGQHILSQAFLRVAKAPTIGFHLGSEVSQIDLDASGLSGTLIRQTEALANRVVFENRPVTVRYVSRDELEGVILRREPKVQGMIRLVDVEGFECTGCCGTHVGRTGEIGLIKVVRADRYKGGMRISFAAGKRALSDYQKKTEILDEACRLFSVSEADLVRKCMKDQEETALIQKRLKGVLQEKLGFESDQLYSEAQGTVKTIIHIFCGREFADVMTILRMLIRKPDVIALFGIESDSPSLLFGRSDSLHVDLRPHMEYACGLIHGKGGGSASLVQGRGTRHEDLPGVLESVKERIQKAL